MYTGGCQGSASSGCASQQQPSAKQVASVSASVPAPCGRSRGLSGRIRQPASRAARTPDLARPTAQKAPQVAAGILRGLQAAAQGSGAGSGGGALTARPARAQPFACLWWLCHNHVGEATDQEGQERVEPGAPTPPHVCPLLVSNCDSRPRSLATSRHAASPSGDMCGRPRPELKLLWGRTSASLVGRDKRGGFEATGQERPQGEPPPPPPACHCGHCSSPWPPPVVQHWAVYALCISMAIADLMQWMHPWDCAQATPAALPPPSAACAASAAAAGGAASAARSPSCSCFLVGGLACSEGSSITAHLLCSGRCRCAGSFILATSVRQGGWTVQQVRGQEPGGIATASSRGGKSLEKGRRIGRRPALCHRQAGPWARLLRLAQLAARRTDPHPPRRNMLPARATTHPPAVPPGTEPRLAPAPAAAPL